MLLGYLLLGLMLLHVLLMMNVLMLLLTSSLLLLLSLNRVKLFEDIDEHTLLVLHVGLVGVADEVHVEAAVGHGTPCDTTGFPLPIHGLKEGLLFVKLIEILGADV